MIVSKNIPNTRLCQAITTRKNKIGISTENISIISRIDKSIVLKVLNGQYVPKKDLDATTKFLGLSAIGKSIEKPKLIRKRRAREKAISIVSMVQGTSSLEGQGLESNRVKRMIVQTEQEFLNGQYKSKLWK
jgi:hypothetical protein